MSGLAAPCLCVVTDRQQVAPEARTRAAEVLALERWLDEVLDAQVDLIQLRERDLDARELLGVAARLVVARGDRATRIVINDRADVALACQADGVHLRGDGPAVSRVRSLGGPSWLVGRSVHGEDEAHEHDSADYLLFGTVFAGGSKREAAPARGVDALARAVRASRAPVLAIGGVTPARAREVLATGAAGVAAIAVFLPEGRVPGALGPARAAAAFRAVFLP